MSFEETPRFGQNLPPIDYPESNYPPEDDGGIDKCSICFDINQYVSKKTISLSLIDVALLSANVSQLRNLLSPYRRQQDFNVVALAMVVISISLQVLQAALVVYLSFKCNINKIKCHQKAIAINNIIAVLSTVIMVVNSLIPIFETQRSPDIDGL